MIRPLTGYELDRVLRRADLERPFPILDRAFDAVERALARLGVEDPGSLRTPGPVERALSDTALPEGTLLILSSGELRAAELDIEDTVRDERSGGTVFASLPVADDVSARVRGLRELTGVTRAFCFQHGPRAGAPTRLGRVTTLAMPTALRGYRFMLADTPGFRVCVVARDLPGGGFVALWSGSEVVVAELRGVLGAYATEAGCSVPSPAPDVPDLDGIDRSADVWDQAEDLRAHRVVRQEELRKIARAAALRGVALRRERDARRTNASRATG